MERKAVSQRASRPFSVPQLSMKRAWSTPLVSVCLASCIQRKSLRQGEGTGAVNRGQPGSAARHKDYSRRLSTLGQGIYSLRPQWIPEECEHDPGYPTTRPKLTCKLNGFWGGEGKPPAIGTLTTR